MKRVQGVGNDGLISGMIDMGYSTSCSTRQRNDQRGGTEHSDPLEPAPHRMAHGYGFFGLLWILREWRCISRRWRILMRKMTDKADDDDVGA